MPRYYCGERGSEVLHGVLGACRLAPQPASRLRRTRAPPAAPRAALCMLQPGCRGAWHRKPQHLVARLISRRWMSNPVFSQTTVTRS